MPPSNDKLDQILTHLQNLDRRDRLRTWGGFFRGIIGLIPAIAFLWGIWYFYQHGDEVLAKIAKEAATQAAEVTRMGSEGIFDQLKNFQVR